MIMESVEKKIDNNLIRRSKRLKGATNKLIKRTIRELKKSYEHIENILKEENEDADEMALIKEGLFFKIQNLQRFTRSENLKKNENIVNDEEKEDIVSDQEVNNMENGVAEKEDDEEKEEEEEEEEDDEEEEENEETKKEEQEIEENENEIQVEVEFSKRNKQKEEKELTFYQDFIKNNEKFQMKYLKKKEIVGYTVSGDAIIIKNENFINFMNSCFSKNRYKGQDSFNTNTKLSIPETEKCYTEEDNYFSESTCSSSSIISLKSFVKQQKKLRIKKNREKYVKHKYYDDSYINHQLEQCSDCSEHSVKWMENKNNELFFYSNLLREDKKIAHKGTMEMIKKTEIKKKCSKHVSPFYKYIYFKHVKENDIYVPVFVNKKNGKKKVCNLNRKNNNSFCNTVIDTYGKRKKIKGELDPFLFSYQKVNILNSARVEDSDEEKEVQTIENSELLSEYKKEVLDIERTAENLLTQTKKLSEIKRLVHFDSKDLCSYDRIIQKYIDFVEKDTEFRFKPLCNVEKINLKIKIVGSDGTIVKHKRLERLSIDKSQTFGYLAKKLGKCFQLSDENIENIKIFFDGDVCDKDATFDDETIGLHDDYQLDVRFPQTKEKILEINNLEFDQCYPIIHPDYYQID